MHVLPVTEPVTIENAMAVARNVLTFVPCIFIVCIMNQQMQFINNLLYCCLLHCPYKWREACLRTNAVSYGPNRPIYLSHCVFISFVRPHCCQSILRPAVACDIGHKLTSSCMINGLEFFLAINLL
jgi:hypothetical protein